ncbi:uncharacterized protein LOC108668213 [Hyalella azteca]|uniref:Uncharacterized protein LOC108668213 n=1 Tax=Hyalella azteca TaxID=294128 RepID=A0A8B7NBB4_HYAAZ|nr:uncharacterized protein LOC108668213 [Hyalella azteca]
MASNAKECPVLSYVKSDESFEQNLPLEPAVEIKVESEVLNMDAPTPVIQVPEIYIKQEPENENLDVTVKEESFLYGSQGGASQHLSAAPADLLSHVPSFCWPGKMELKAEMDADESALASAAGDAGSKQWGCRGSVPELPEPRERRVFKTKLEKPEIINAWLKKHRKNIISRNYLRKRDFDDYDKVLLYLIRNKDAILSRQKAPLRDAIKFGYFLQLMYKNRFQQNLGEIPRFSYETILSEHIGISKSLAQNLQWLGKLGYQYPKLGKVSLYLYQMFRRRPAIANLFRKFPHLANKWK